MKIILYLLILFFSAANVFGQSGTRYQRVVVEVSKEKRQKRIEIKTEINPQLLPEDSVWFHTFDKVLHQLIENNKYLKRGKYISIVRFIIDKNGYITNITPEKISGFGIDANIISALRLGKPPRWEPAQQNNPANAE